MPRSYRVIVTPGALDEIAAIMDFIALDSRQNACEQVDRILAEVESLEMFPGRYSRRDDPDYPGKDLHSMPIPPFRVIYEIVDSLGVVRVLAIEHGSRQ